MLSKKCGRIPASKRKIPHRLLASAGFFRVSFWRNKTSLLADGAHGACIYADRVAAVFFAVGALGRVDDIAGVSLIDGGIGTLGSAGTAADALVRIDFAGH